MSPTEFLEAVKSLILGTLDILGILDILDILVILVVLVGNKPLVIFF